MDASVSAKAIANTFEADVREIVTAKYLRAATANDAVAGVQPGLLVEPGNEQELAKHGQRLALDALWPERATVGGVLSTNDSGALRLRFGSLRDLVIGVTLALADGTVASSGGRVVKNVAGYDLPKLATGELGTLGIITRA